jgi:hypothetical protein
VPTLRIAQDPAAGDLLSRDPLALLIAAARAGALRAGPGQHPAVVLGGGGGA